MGGEGSGGMGYLDCVIIFFPIAPYQYATVTFVVLSSFPKQSYDNRPHRLSSIVQNPSSGF